MDEDTLRRLQQAREPKPKKVRAPLKRKTKIPTKSDRQKFIDILLKALYPVYLNLFPVCNVKSPICTYHSNCVNHTQGRGENEVLNILTWEPCCTSCNGYIEEHHAWARKYGHKKFRHHLKPTDN